MREEIKNKKTIGQVLMRVSIITFLIGLILAAIASYQIGRTWGNLLNAEKITLIEKIKRAFNENQKVYCNNKIILKSSNWTFELDEKKFIKDDSYIDIEDCIDSSSVSLKDAIKATDFL